MSDQNPEETNTILPPPGDEQEQEEGEQEEGEQEEGEQEEGEQEEGEQEEGEYQHVDVGEHAQSKTDPRAEEAGGDSTELSPQRNDEAPRPGTSEQNQRKSPEREEAKTYDESQPTTPADQEEAQEDRSINETDDQDQDEADEPTADSTGPAIPGAQEEEAQEDNRAQKNTEGGSEQTHSVQSNEETENKPPTKSTSKPHRGDALTARVPRPPNMSAKKPPNTARVSKAKISAKKDLHLVALIGVGTVGLGQRAGGIGGEDDHRATIAQLSYKEWKLSKEGQQQNEAQRKEGQPTYPQTPRELYEYGKEKSVMRHDRKGESDRSRAERETKERNAHREALLRQREKEADELRAGIQLERERDRKKKDLALSQFSGDKAEELRRQRVKLREERSDWQKMIQEEKVAERERLNRNKAVWQRHHEASLEEQKRCAEERKHLVEEEKRHQKEKLDKWRREQESMEREQHQLTETARKRASEGLKRSKAQHHTARSEEVHGVRDEFAKIKQEIDVRRLRREQQVQADIDQVKQDQVSTYAEKKKEMLRQKQKKAQRIRQQSEGNLQTHRDDMQEHSELAALRRKEVQADLRALREMRVNSPHRRGVA